MVDLSYLFSFADFSLTEFIFGEDKNKKNNDKKQKNNKNIVKTEAKKKNNKNDIKKFSEKEKKLILKLEIEIDNFLYRKKVTKLIQKLKDNYEIICSANIPNLYINLYSSKKKKIKQLKLIYEPILKQNIVFLPRKIYRNKKKLKFNFVNSKNEIFIEPKYKTENEDGSFVNVIDLREMKEKEFKNYEDFENFLKEFRNKKKEKNIKNEIKEVKNEIKVEENKINIDLKNKNNYLDDKNEINEIKTNYVTDNEFGNSKEDLKPKKIRRRKFSVPSLSHNNKNSLNSILKDRSAQRIPNPRKISFGDVQFSY